MEENSIPQENTTVEESRMRKHIHVAAILQIVFGSLIVIGGLAIAFAFGFVDQFVDDPTALKVLAIVGTPLIVMFLLFGGAMIAGGVGLLSCKSWARILTLVMAALGSAEHTHRNTQGCLYHLGARAAGDCFPLCQRLPGELCDTIKKHYISAAGKMIIFVVSNRMNYG